MSIESSNRGAQVASENASRSLTDYLALAISTWGVGYIPIAPGTWGSVVGALVFWGVSVQFASLSRASFLVTEFVVALIITFLGIWAGSRVERLLKRKDPGRVVVDEVAGQMIALLPLAWFTGAYSIGWVIVSFTLFRFFDIVKPYPARRFERFNGGVGIMADDLVAGVYGALVTAAAIAVFHH